MFEPDILKMVSEVLGGARRRGWRIATAESCTGGLLAAALTAAPGSSDVFDRGLVTYSNAAKTELLGVSASLIETEGAVSEGVAEAMARGALTASAADLAISITGVAGPGGGTPSKPVGRVVFCCAARGAAPKIVSETFPDLGREGIRRASVIRALNLLMSEVQRLPVQD